MTSNNGIPYRLYRIPFPNFSAAGCTVDNGDGTYSIFINSRCSETRQLLAFYHELNHLEYGHFNSDASMDEIESDACFYGIRHFPVFDPENTPAEELQRFYDKVSAIIRQQHAG